ncbi:MAG: hypothetical protein KDC44_03705, partial [Phaeodactylibacter sp.]|nr:hypothetical protein [Phaeodactylibacter sp.]
GIDRLAALFVPAGHDNVEQFTKNCPGSISSTYVEKSGSNLFYIYENLGRILTGFPDFFTIRYQLFLPSN